MRHTDQDNDVTEGSILPQLELREHQNSTVGGIISKSLAAGDQWQQIGNIKPMPVDQ